MFVDLAEESFGTSQEEVELRVLIPAFMISELRRGFEIGFIIALPFLVIDIMVATIIMSMGMMMMPPTVIALPFKILFFVLIDGWNLLVKLDVAYTGMNAAIEVVDEIKAKLVAARGASDDDKGKIQSEITELQNQLKSIGMSASFSGENFLATDNTDAVEIVGSFSRDNAGNVSIGTINFAVESSQLFNFDENADDGIATHDDGGEGLLNTELVAVDSDGNDVDLGVSILDLTVEDTDAQDIDYLISAVDGVLKDMTTAASDLGAAKKRVDMQSDFVSKLQDAIDRGVGQLVDADMQAESARLSALQVQQQLGIQSLSIANANAQNILSLFR
jgi:flagellin